MKKVGVVIFVLVFMFVASFVSSQVVSNDDRDISILGCSDGDSAVGIGECLNGEFYCQADDTLFGVFDVAGATPNACAGFQTGEPKKICCPAGGQYSCTENADGDRFCIPTTKDCDEFTSKDECMNYAGTGNAGQCYWDENAETKAGEDLDEDGDMDGLCLPYSRGCYDYNEADCIADPQDVAENDPNCKYGESVSGGVSYVVSQDTCKCVWDESEESCGLTFNVTSVYGTTFDWSLCNFVLKITEPCKDGFEKYAYEAKYDDTMGLTGSVLPGDVGCGTRSGTRRCGESVVKVPFFDFVNFLAVVFILLSVYAFRNKIFIGGEK
jgi:hypothetical protein